MNYNQEAAETQALRIKELEAQVAMLREALDLNYDLWHGFQVIRDVEKFYPEESTVAGNAYIKAQSALTATTSDRLRKHDAEVESTLLRRLVDGANGGECGARTCQELLELAAELEKPQ